MQTVEAEDRCSGGADGEGDGGNVCGADGGGDGGSNVGGGRRMQRLCKRWRLSVVRQAIRRSTRKFKSLNIVEVFTTTPKNMETLLQTRKTESSINNELK